MIKPEDSYRNYHQMPANALIKMSKYIKAERNRGYDNRAVLGGMDKILASWVSEAILENIPEQQISLVKDNLDQYPQSSPDDRRTHLESIWTGLNLDQFNSMKPESIVPDKAASRSKSENASNPQMHTPQSVNRLQPATSAETRSPGDALFGIDASLQVLPGIGPVKAKSLAMLGLLTLGDLLYYFPRRYDDYSQLKPIRELTYGQDVTVVASVQEVNTHPIRNRNIKITEAIVSDGSSMLRLTWFNQPWIARRLHPGRMLSISGRVDQYLGRPVISNPEFEELDAEQLHTNRIVPIYSLTGNITQRWLRNQMYHTISYWSPRVTDFLPPETLERNHLIDLSSALYQIHFPDKQETIRAARDRLSFDEIFLLQLGVLRQKASWQSLPARRYAMPDAKSSEMFKALPYALTKAQERVFSEIASDLGSGRPMNRLLQGDVGAGKTILATLAVAIIANENAQSALMAPTSILASQHLLTITRLLESNTHFPIRPEQIRLLIGDTPAQEKEVIRNGLEDGSIRLVIGTHALIESPVQFKDLQLVIVDEQHRFGVAQRALLRSKGDNPHLLVMTATPIPRSLALTVYGDLDLSVLDEMPPGRQLIETSLLSPQERTRAYQQIRDQVALGYQAFIIYPLVEEGEREETKAAVEEHARLQKQVFPDLSLGLLHGRLKPEEKESVMSGFRDGRYQILVSTSVIEVGVDIPNATIILIEGANRFGLAQLHQFRGRVGRGIQQSYCLLIPETNDSLENERLSAMTQTNDGFILAEKDLEQRGPGDFLGTRQSGFSELKLAELTDIHLIEKARNEAHLMFAKDPELSRPEFQMLAQSFRRFWKLGQGDIS
jgi:ATP-dependent DNA helicase RecG